MPSKRLAEYNGILTLEQKFLSHGPLVNPPAELC